MKKKIKVYNGVKGERILSNAETYEKETLKDKIVSAFVWAFWISIILSWIVSCTDKIL